MFGLGKKKEEGRKTYLFPDSIVYTEYEIGPIQRIGCWAAGLAAGFALGMIFYGLIPLAIVAGVGGAIAAVPLFRKVMLERRTKELKEQFRDMLEAVATAIGAGQNVTDAFTSAYGDLRVQHSENAYIVKELGNIVAGMNNNINIETILLDFAERSGLDDVRSFASVFETSYRKGGNIKDVVQSTYEIMSEKIEVEMEIQTMVASSSSELNIMLFMPILIILMLRLMGGESVGQGTFLSIVSTTVALVIIVASYLLGRRMMRIKL